MPTDIAKEKQALRRSIRRRGLPAAYLTEAGRSISRRALAMPEYRRANTVLAFVSLPSEPDLYDFLRSALADGKRLAVPLCIGEGVMEAREIYSLKDLRPGKYGILEPSPRCPAVPPEEIQFALIPCVTCTAGGKRLGHGGGYYDRYLANYRAAAALVCPEALLSREIPVEDFDIRIPLVITENAVYIQHA